MGDEPHTKMPLLIHDTSSVYFLHPSEGPGMPLTKYVLIGDNYDVWSKAILNALEGKHKQGFINGDISKPTDSQSPEYIAWGANNSTICGWMFNSIDISIQPSVAGHKIAFEMWNDLKERYAVINGPRIHQLKTEYHTLRQKGMTVVSYYNKFKSLWDALYGAEDLTCECTCSAAPKIRAYFDISRTHDFLLGLDDSQYGALRTQILGMEPVPVLNKVFSLVAQEERHLHIVRDRDDKTEALSFAVNASHSSASQPRFTPSNSPHSGPLSCTYCGKAYHDYDHCYARLGYPAGGSRGRGKGRQSRGRGRGTAGRVSASPTNVPVVAHAASAPSFSSPGASSSISVPGLTSDLVQRLLTLIDTSPANDTLSGKHISDFGVWLIDSGASHHMTGTLSHLFNITAVPPLPVSLPDGVHASATKQGSVRLSSSLTLDNVLYVPNIKCNLISVGKLFLIPIAL